MHHPIWPMTPSWPPSTTPLFAIDVLLVVLRVTGGPHLERRVNSPVASAGNCANSSILVDLTVYPSLSCSRTCGHVTFASEPAHGLTARLIVVPQLSGTSAAPPVAPDAPVTLPSCRRSRRCTRRASMATTASTARTPTVASSHFDSSPCSDVVSETPIATATAPFAGCAGPSTSRSTGATGPRVDRGWLPHRLGDPVDARSPSSMMQIPATMPAPESCESPLTTSSPRPAPPIEAGDDDHGEHHHDRLVHAEQDRRTRERHLHLPEQSAIRSLRTPRAASTISVGTWRIPRSVSRIAGGSA